MKRRRNRRAYKDAIAIFVASFASIALISTGLAAFVLVRDATIAGTGNIVVGAVVDNEITLKFDNLNDLGTIKLDPAANDTTGRVQWDEENSESLTYDVSGTIDLPSTGNRVLGDVELYYQVNVKDNNGSAAEAAFKTAFMTAPDDRLALKSPTTDFATRIATNVSGEEDGIAGTFSFVFGFEWGAKYDGSNPSLYYDGAGSGEDLDDVKTELDALKAAESYTFEITVFANFKVIA